MSFDFNYWAMLEPMKYYDKADDSALSTNLLKKKYAMIENEEDDCVATQKWDGEWTMFIKGHGDDLLIRSRSLSKVTGAYGDKTQHLPHLAYEMAEWPEGTVVLAEVCWDEMGTVSTDVGTILRCLPAKAVARQKDHKLVAKVFDILCWADENMMSLGYFARLQKVIKEFSNPYNHYFTNTDYYLTNFQIAADNIIRQGGEGLVIQRKNYVYEPGKRTAWKTLKMKQHLEEMELKVVGTKDPTKLYQGKEKDTWCYWLGTYTDDGTTVRIDHVPGNIDKEAGLKWEPVSKAYYYGWKMGITVDFNGTLVDASSGLSDEDREWLATDVAQQLIEKGQLYATIRSMMVATLGGLRHPVIQKIRIMDDAMMDGIENN